MLEVYALFVKICYVEIMKKLVLFILLSFLLVGCSEEKKTDIVKKENKYVNIDLMKKLSAIDEINLEKDIKRMGDGKTVDLSMLMLFYVSNGTRLIYCDAMLEIKKEIDEDAKKDKLKDLYLKQSDDECNLYREIYDKYNYIYYSIIKTNSKISYFHFDLKEEFSDNNESIGIFPTKKECEYYANLFREKNIGLTSGCKEGIS